MSTVATLNGADCGYTNVIIEKAIPKLQAEGKIDKDAILVPCYKNGTVEIYTDNFATCDPAYIIEPIDNTVDEILEIAQYTINNY